ncbi:MAG TPA: formate dehydrogenase, partial [Marinobacter sp.]|nr:formate dehydrogenase [Marinobacter sp.]
MPTTIYVPCDTTALSLGADEVARQIRDQADSRGADIQIVRNGSRGLFWLEPLVEVMTARGRVAYGPVEPEQVAELVAAGLFEGNPGHPLYLGPIEDHPYLKRQQRLTFSRIGITDPVSLDDYIAHDGFSGLAKAVALTPQAIVDEIKASGLRGRGGAAFPAGIKWQTVLDEPAGQQKYIVCNADEGDSGTFADRLVMECDP